MTRLGRTSVKQRFSPSGRRADGVVADLCEKLIGAAHVLGMTTSPINQFPFQLGEPLLSLDDLVAFTGTPKSTLYSLLSAGRGPVKVKIGRNLKFRPIDVNAWIDSLAEDSAA